MARIRTYVIDDKPEIGDLLVGSEASNPGAATKNYKIGDIVSLTAIQRVTTDGNGGPTTLIDGTLNVPIYSVGVGDPGGVTGVGFVAPPAFIVNNAPILSNGTIELVGAGYETQYIDGTGSLRDFPSIGLVDSGVTPGDYTLTNITVNSKGIITAASNGTGSVAAGPPGPPGPAGVNGTNGVNGSNGSDGADGSNGTNGTNGSDGIQGEPGADGTSIEIQGTVPAVGDLPATGNTLGDLWIIDQTGGGATAGDGYVWTAESNWLNIGPLRGPQGIQGIQGEAGQNGSNGINGSNGTNGTNGVDGADGQNGTNGEDGARGEQGIQGNPGQQGEPGAKGDQGIQGLRGLLGDKGDKGDKGDQGIQGEAGQDGSTDLTNTASEIEVTVNSSTGDNTSILGATTTAAGVMTKDDKIKLDKAIIGTTVTQNAIAEIKTLTLTEYQNLSPKLATVMYVII